MNVSHWEANTTPFRTYSKMFMIKPASKPPRNTRAKLIFPIGILHERSPECPNSKGAEGTVGWSLRGGHGTSQEEGEPKEEKRALIKARWRPEGRRYSNSSWANSSGADLVLGLRPVRARASSSILAM